MPFRQAVHCLGSQQVERPSWTHSTILRHLFKESSNSCISRQAPSPLCTPVSILSLKLSRVTLSTRYVPTEQRGPHRLRAPLGVHRSLGEQRTISLALSHSRWRSMMVSRTVSAWGSSSPLFSAASASARVPYFTELRAAQGQPTGLWGPWVCPQSLQDLPLVLAR